MPATESGFSGILRCLLCKGSLPTHPSDDHYIESNVKDEAKYHLKQAYERSARSDFKKPLASSSHSPGLVARLMGLDSLPDPRNPTLGSILRSRSVNSIDFLSHLDLHHQHRRVRTSVSFHEDDYYSVVLRLQEEVVDENDVREHECQIKNKTKLNGHHEEEKDKQKKRIRKYNTERTVIKGVNGVCVKSKTSSGDGNGVKSQRENVCGKTSPRLLRERRKNPKKEAFTGSSKSVKSEKMVADHKVHSVRSLKKIHPEDSVQDAELAKKQRSIRSSTSETAVSKKRSCSRSLRCDDGESRTFVEGKVEKRKIVKTDEKCNYRSVVEVICKLTEESLDKSWTTMMHGDGVVLKFENTEKICRQLEEAILEDLLTEFVDEKVVIIFGARK